MELPTVNIKPGIRFTLYLLASLSLLFVAYAVDKEWAGDAEVKLVNGVSALLFILAAAKTTLTGGKTTLTGTVVSERGEVGAIEAEVQTEPQKDGDGPVTDDAEPPAYPHVP